MRVGGHKRNIMLPSALASYRPREAKLEDGALRVRFERQDPSTRRAGPGAVGRRWHRRSVRGTGDMPHDPVSLVRGPAARRERRRRRARAAQIEHQCLDFCPICRTADVLRAALPPEFQEHWHALQREGLLAARALLDHYIHHLESQRASAAPVEDIPIE